MIILHCRERLRETEKEDKEYCVGKDPNLPEKRARKRETDDDISKLIGGEKEIDSWFMFDEEDRSN